MRRTTVFSALAAAAMVLWAGSMCGATDTTWQHDPTTPGDWFAAGNWTSGVPGSTSAVYVNNGGTLTVSTPAAAYDVLMLGSVAGASGSVTITGGGGLAGDTLSVGTYGSGTVVQEGGQSSMNYYLIVGEGGAGQYFQSGGSVTARQGLYVGDKSGSNGTYFLSGSGVLTANSQGIGGGGNGRFVQTGGTNQGYSMTVGGVQRTVGRYELSQGTVVASSYLSIGQDGQGTFAQTGGQNRVGDLVLGFSSSGLGTYELSGSGYLTTTNELIGHNTGNGVFNQTGGTHVAGNVKVGDSPYDTGLLDISGGTLTATQLNVGYGHSRGTLTVRGPGASISAGGYVQDATGSLCSIVQPTGLAELTLSGTAALNGTWTVQDAGATAGRFDVLYARGGISGTFSAVQLPGPDWSWGIQNQTTLWVSHIPEPATLSLLVLGGLLAVRKRRK